MTWDYENAGREHRALLSLDHLCVVLWMRAERYEAVARLGVKRGQEELLTVDEGDSHEGGGINVVLAVNVIPTAPLDGGRLLRAVVWRISGDRLRAAVWSARSGQMFGWALVVVAAPGIQQR